MPDAKPLSFQVPAPAVRPGGTPDFSDVQISRAGEVRRPDVDAAPEDIRRDPRYLDTVDDIWTSLKGYLN